MKNYLNITVKRPGTGQFPTNSLKNFLVKKPKNQLKKIFRLKKIIYLGNLLNILFKFSLYKFSLECLIPCLQL